MLNKSGLITRRGGKEGKKSFVMKNRREEQKRRETLIIIKCLWLCFYRVIAISFFSFFRNSGGRR